MCNVIISDSAKTGKDFVPNYDVIIENIKDLNSLAGDGEAKVVNTTGGAKLKVTIFDIETVPSKYL